MLQATYREYKFFFGILLRFIFFSHSWENSVSAAHLKYWRKFLLLSCSIMNYQTMVDWMNFFGADKQRTNMVMRQTHILEQATRQWLYYKSTSAERVSLAIEHFSFLERSLATGAFQKIYNENGVILWEGAFNADKLSLRLCYDRFYRKEGLLAISFAVGEDRIYSITFWLSSDKTGENALWVGSLQGGKGKATVIRALTKHFFGYRPKNLMIHVLRLLAENLQLNKMYAVSNYGSYVNHRFRDNRKLKTSLDEFWQEIGGQISLDRRFFKILVAEPKKNIKDIASHKRNLYRKRFALLDKMDEQLQCSMKALTNKKTDQLLCKRLSAN